MSRVIKYRYKWLVSTMNLQVGKQGLVPFSSPVHCGTYPRSAVLTNYHVGGRGGGGGSYPKP